MRKILGAAVALGMLAVGPMAPPASAQSGVNVGVLTCHVSSGWGFVFGSSKSLRCTFSPAPGKNENYAGTINKFGVDIGYSQIGRHRVGGAGADRQRRPGRARGTYVGATASVSAGPGVGAHVLVGGSEHSISLQPLSIEGNTGLNVAGGIAGIVLKPEKM